MKIKAYSLLEVILVLTVVAISAVVVIRYYSEVKDREKITALIQQYNDITTAVQKCVHITVPDSSGNAPTINCFRLTDLIDAGYLDNSINSNPWGDASTGYINILRQGSSDSMDFEVISLKVPNLSCAKIKNSATSKLPSAISVTYSTNACIYKGYTQDNESSN